MAGETERFLREALGTPGPDTRRLLEVGAGDGRLAARLARLGWDVTAAESDPKRAAAARGRGILVLEGDFLANGELDHPPRFDVVLFSRVLHHLEPLEAALDRADDVLAAGGSVAGEEFAWERADEAAIRWLAGARARASAAGLLPEEADPPRETLASWRRHHGEDHRIHRGDLLLEGLAARFSIVRREDPAYLYRYLCTRLADTPQAAEFAAALCDEERRAIAAGTIPALGLRFVAARRR